METIVILIIVGLLPVGAGCLDKDTQTPAEGILVKGSDTVLPLAQAVSESFMAKYPNKSITVIGGGSGVGIAALIDDEVDIAMSSREMKDLEIKNANFHDVYPIEHAICWDGIAVVVHPDNPVSTLTLSQIRGIYNGSISNWEDVGGADRKIVVMSRDSSSGTYEYYKQNVLMGDNVRPDALIQSATGAIILEISHNKNAIGYIGIAYLEKDVKPLFLSSGSDYALPTPDNIKNGTYPLARPLYFYTNGEPDGLTKEFLDFVLSQTGQEIATDVGYLPIT